MQAVQIPEVLTKHINLDENPEIINLGFVHSHHYVSLRTIERFEMSDEKVNVKAKAKVNTMKNEKAANHESNRSEILEKNWLSLQMK